MAHEVAGVPLTTFEDPIYRALTRYSEITDGRVLFGFLERAVKLEPTPDKPYSARSSVPVYHENEEMGTLYTIAFAPHDATGDDKTFKDADIATSRFPREPKYSPRSKAAAHAEVHLAIASQTMESQNDPVMFTGHLSLIGVVGGNHVIEAGYIGQESHTFASAMRNRQPQYPRATLTTGYRGEMDNLGDPGERFGDPHALLNWFQGVVQVAGFIAISPEAAAAHLDAFRELKAEEPLFARFRR
jgi:hypothetical protein